MDGGIEGFLERIGKKIVWRDCGYDGGCRVYSVETDLESLYDMGFVPDEGMMISVCGRYIRIWCEKGK